MRNPDHCPQQKYTFCSITICVPLNHQRIVLTQVNVVIMSDHGMTYGSNPIPIHHPPSFPFNTIEVRQIQMSYILKSVQRIVKMTVGSGAYMQIYPKQERFIPEIIEALRAELDGKGVDIFTRDEIPDHLHWRDNVNTPPILILARPGVILLRAGGNLQRPASSLQLYGGGYDPARITEQTQQGVSGYDPEETDMRGVFMARGPGRKLHCLLWFSPFRLWAQETKSFMKSYTLTRKFFVVIL